MAFSIPRTLATVLTKSLCSTFAILQTPIGLTAMTLQRGLHKEPLVTSYRFLPPRAKLVTLSDVVAEVFCHFWKCVLLGDFWRGM